MNLRITQTRQLALGQQRASNHLSDVARLRNQISSGVKVERPSDNPRAQELILDQQAVISQVDTRSALIDEVRFVLSEAHTQVRTAQNYVVQAKDIALQANTRLDKVEADAFALELDSLLSSLERIANSRHAGRYLFGGTDLQSPPYGDVSFETSYSGTRVSGTTYIAGGGHMRTFYAGPDVFSTGQTGTTFVSGTTGIVGGRGTSTGHGSSELLVSHTGTIYDGTTGLTPGINSAGGDTILGPMGQHTVHIIDTAGDGSAGTISLNGGEPVAFTSADDNLLVTGPQGARIYVNTTAIVAGTDTTIDLQANGTISLDNGLSSQPIDFSANQLLVDPDGNSRYFDTRQASLTGTAEVELTGATDIFHQIRRLRDDLRNHDQYTSEEWSARVGEHIGALQDSSDHLLKVVGEQSVDLEQLDMQQDRSADVKADAERILSSLQSTDLTEAILELQEKELQHQFTLATLARAYDSSILDYL